jgi:hypothetical protein
MLFLNSRIIIENFPSIFVFLPFSSHFFASFPPLLLIMYGQYGQQGGGDYSYGQTGYSANSDQPYYMQYGGGQNVAQPAAQQCDNFSANPFDEPPQNPYQQDTTLGGFYDEPAPVYHPSDPYSQPYSNAGLKQFSLSRTPFFRLTTCSL